jgi:3-phenylpropionate/trans-cinnamate dioxygenase ferredoxin subunit
MSAFADSRRVRTSAWAVWPRRRRRQQDHPCADETRRRETEAAWVDVAPADDLGRGPLVLAVHGVQVLLIPRGKQVIGVVDSCPHLGLRLSDGRIANRSITCGAHGGRWDLMTGQPVPAGRCATRRPLHRVAARVHAGQIQVDRRALS